MANAADPKTRYYGIDKQIPMRLRMGPKRVRAAAARADTEESNKLHLKSDQQGIFLEEAEAQRWEAEEVVTLDVARERHRVRGRKPRRQPRVAA